MVPSLLASALLFATTSVALIRYVQTPGRYNTPARGWNSFGLQQSSLSNFGLTLSDIETQCSKLWEDLEEHGYTVCSLDSGWSDGSKSDEWGRYQVGFEFLDGRSGTEFADFIDKLHDNGMGIGLYVVPGIFEEDTRTNKTVYNTDIKLADIMKEELDDDGNQMSLHLRVNIDTQKDGAQEYCNSNVDLWAEWGIDYIRLDFIKPGSPPDDPSISKDNSDIVSCYRNAIDQNGRKMYLDISWKLDISPEYHKYWSHNADALRVDQDVTPGDDGSGRLTTWRQVQRTIENYRRYMVTMLDRGTKELSIYPDLDNLVVGNNEDLSGLNTERSFTMLAHWLGAGGNVMLGSDLTKMSELSLQWLQDARIKNIRDFCAQFPLVPQLGNDDLERGTQGQVWMVGPAPDTNNRVLLFANYGPEDEAGELKPNRAEYSELREQVTLFYILPEGCWRVARTDRRKDDAFEELDGGNITVTLGYSESAFYFVLPCEA